MAKRINQFITCVVVFWILVFIFQKEILSYIAGWGPSWVKDLFIQTVGFMVLWAGKAWVFIQSVFQWLADRVLKIISNLDPFAALAKKLAELISGILKSIIDFLTPFFSKATGK